MQIDLALDYHETKYIYEHGVIPSGVPSGHPCATRPGPIAIASMVPSASVSLRVSSPTTSSMGEMKTRFKLKEQWKRLKIPPSMTASNNI